MKFDAGKILVIATRQIGDVFLVTPLLRSIRRAYPHACIDVLAYANTNGLLENNPDINNQILVPEHPTLAEYMQFLPRVLRRYDLAVSTLCGDRPIVYAFLAAKRCISVVPPQAPKHRWKRLVLSAHTDFDNVYTHTVVQNLKLADLMGIPRCYDTVVPECDAEQLEALMSLRLADEPYAMLHVFPKWRYKQWTKSGWRGLFGYLESRGWRVLVTGGADADEQQYISEVIGPNENVLNLAGSLTLPQVAKLATHAQVYVGPDTAVTHLAAATGAPVVAFFGPTNPVKWGPWPKGYAADSSPYRMQGSFQVAGNVVLLQGVAHCVPCLKEGCLATRSSYSQCLDDLPLAHFIRAIEMHENPPEVSSSERGRAEPPA